MKRLLLFLTFGGSLLAAPPAWWGDSPTRIYPPNPTPAPNNVGPANLGQLKNVAKMAAQYLNNTNTLPTPGAGAQINAMVDGFHKSDSDLSPVNLGQLKAVAKPFYDRLHDVGFDTRHSLQSHSGLDPVASSWTHDYPWDENAPKSGNLAPANIGQLKWVFSFDLTGFSVVDTDTDGIPNNWETAHGLNSSNSADRDLDPDGDGLTNLQEYLQGTDPQDFWNGQPPALAIVSGNGQGDLTGHSLANPYVVKLTNQMGTPKVGQSVSFVILSGGGSLSIVNSGITDAGGMAKATLTLPAASPGTVINVKASYATASATFTATIGDPSQSAQPPSNSSVSLSADETQAYLSWEDHANNETAYYVDRTEDNQNWTRVAMLPANTTSYTDTGLQPGVCYIYRVGAHK